MEETADHQHNRTLFRGSAATDAPHGLLCEREKRRPNYLFHLPALYPGMENPHPQPIYTSSVTSPRPVLTSKTPNGPPPSSPSAALKKANSAFTPQKYHL